MDSLGVIQILDLEIVARHYGHLFLPHPFRWSRRSHFETRNQYRDYARSVPDRLRHGDLQLLHLWFQSYSDADIRVQCNVDGVNPKGPGLQILAHRLDQSGYLAIQRPGENEIDLFATSPYELGEAIVESLNLTKPGRHPEIWVSGILDDSSESIPLQADAVRDEVKVDPAPKVCVASTEISTFSIVQSNRHAARFWGFEIGRKTVVWGTRVGDGDYISVPRQTGEARPMARSDLVSRINLLIADDVRALRELRAVPEL